MTIYEMVIKARLLLHKVNSNVYNSIGDEEWCDILNTTITEFVRSKCYDPADNNRDDYEIRNYYEGIQSLIRNKTFHNPANYEFYQNSRYANLSDLNDISGSRFVCKPNIKSGFKYRIVTKYGSDNFTSIGATENIAGEIFIAKFVSSVQPTMYSGTGGTVLRYGLNAYTTNGSNLYAGVNYIVLKGTVTFPIGYANKVILNGKSYYLTGGLQNRTTNLVATAEDTFVIYQEYTTQWSGYSILEEQTDNAIYFKYISSTSEISYNCGNINNVKTVANRLVKSDFIEQHLNHSRGAMISSPLVILENNNVVVFHNKNLSNVKLNERFDINSITVKYIKKPNEVSVSANIDCDLDEIVHEQIVREAVNSLNASVSNENYTALKNEQISKVVK